MAINFEPKYNCFKPDENTLEIRVELPGNVKVDITSKIIGEETIITIKGEKKKDRKPDNPEDNFLNTREYGEFELNIPLNIKDFKIKGFKPKDGFPTFKYGIFLLQYELYTNPVEITNDVDI